VTASRAAVDPGWPDKSPPRMVNTAACVLAMAPLAALTADAAVLFLSDVPESQQSKKAGRTETNEAVDGAPPRLEMPALAALMLLKMLSWNWTQAKLSLFAARPPLVAFVLVLLEERSVLFAAELVLLTAELVLFAIAVLLTAELVLFATAVLLALVLLEATLVLVAAAAELLSDALACFTARPR
jgi:hypothetical protein